MSSHTIQENKDLSTFNTFGIKVKTRFFAAIRSIEELRALLQDPEWQKIPHFILGGGSNVLFTQDFAGLVIRNEITGIECIDEDDDHVWLKIGAGENWHGIVMHCVKLGYGGIENLSLIPGTVGAAPMQNIGAYGAEFKDVFHQLEAVSIADGSVAIFTHD